MQFVFSIFISAFLIFQIQPMIGKYILPWFGGTPSVWSTSMLFFQVLLTGGYAYSYWLVGRLSNRRQGTIHLILLGASLVLLGITSINWPAPTLPDASWRPQDVTQPIADVLIILFVAVGIPYFLLSTNSTLMQTWFNRKFPDRSPYWLYALSNVGSIIGLVTYPILFEPMLTLTAQSWLWTAGYVVFSLMAGYIAWGVFRGAKRSLSAPTLPVVEAKGPLPAARTLVMWITMAAIASIMLLATTSQITQEVAAIPFLWVLPLTVYLASFILTFSGERWYHRNFYLSLLFLSTIAYLWIIFSNNTHFIVQIIIYSVLLFASTMICHGELYRSRPNPAHLTSFYLMVSVGGAVGGIAVSLVAPIIFNGYWEFQIGLIATWVLVLVTILRHPQLSLSRFSRLLVVLVGTVTFLLTGLLYIQIQTITQDSLVSIRNFYGVLRVLEYQPDDPDNHNYALSHGVTLHGFQYLSPEKRKLPTAYFTEETGIGLTFLNHPSRPGALNVGILGLGIGVQGAYGQAEEDYFRFYEINPAVVEILEGPYFSYLEDTPAQVEIVLGDARTVLEGELDQNKNQQFDLLVMDAFNSDSIPVHLLTREAFEVYLEHLKPGGILALNISNRHLDLRPVVWRLADEFELEGLFFENSPTDGRSKPAWWIILTQNQTFLQNPEITLHGQSRPADMPELRLWTDDYNNLFQILK